MNFHRGALLMVADKLLKMISQLLILVLITRHFSSDEVGSLLYCFALASLFLFLNQLGLDSLIQKKFTDSGGDEIKILSDAFIARLAASVLCILAINAIGFYIVEEKYLLVLFIISLYHLYLPFSTFEWYFQAKGRADTAALALILGQLVSFSFRLYVVLYDRGLLLFSLGYIIELLIPSVFYIVTFYRMRMLKRVEVVWKDIAAMLKESFPLMVSGAVIMLYMKIDQILLGYFAGENEVAFYVAGTRLSEAWYFLGLTILGVYYPKAAALKREGSFNDFLVSYAKTVRLVIAGSLAVVFFTILLSDYIVNILYGNKYEKSSDVLMITILCVPFVYLGSATLMVCLESNDNKAILYRSLLGLMVSMSLNLALIAELGAIGSAIASLGAQVVSGFLSIYLVKKSRHTLILFVRLVFLGK